MVSIRLQVHCGWVQFFKILNNEKSWRACRGGIGAGSGSHAGVAFLVRGAVAAGFCRMPPPPPAPNFLPTLARTQTPCRTRRSRAVGLPPQEAPPHLKGKAMEGFSRCRKGGDAGGVWGGRRGGKPTVGRGSFAGGGGGIRQNGDWAGVGDAGVVCSERLLPERRAWCRGGGTLGVDGIRGGAGSRSAAAARSAAARRGRPSVNGRDTRNGFLYALVAGGAPPLKPPSAVFCFGVTCGSCLGASQASITPMA